MPLPRMEYGAVGQCYALLRRGPGSLAQGKLATTLQFTVKEIDPASGEGWRDAPRARPCSHNTFSQHHAVCPGLLAQRAYGSVHLGLSRRFNLQSCGSQAQALQNVVSEKTGFFLVHSCHLGFALPFPSGQMGVYPQVRSQ